MKGKSQENGKARKLGKGREDEKAATDGDDDDDDRKREQCGSGGRNGGRTSKQTRALQKPGEGDRDTHSLEEAMLTATTVEIEEKKRGRGRPKGTTNAQKITAAASRKKMRSCEGKQRKASAEEGPSTVRQQKKKEKTGAVKVASSKQKFEKKTNKSKKEKKNTKELLFLEEGDRSGEDEIDGGEASCPYAENEAHGDGKDDGEDSGDEAFDGGVVKASGDNGVIAKTRRGPDRGMLNKSSGALKRSTGRSAFDSTAARENVRQKKKEHRQQQQQRGRGRKRKSAEAVDTASEEEENQGKRVFFTGGGGDIDVMQQTSKLC